MRRAPRLAAALALALAACGEPPRPPNVLLVTIDTVRADRLGCYGQTAREITPRLDAFAAQAVLFERAYANSSFTPPTHASLMTGRLPAEHGLMHWNKRLAEVPTLAQSFAAAGYRTLAFTPMKSLLLLGLDRGFHQTTAPPHREEGEQILLAGADELLDAALPELCAPAPQPWFAWLHFYDAHRPFAHQGPEWWARFGEIKDPQVGATERWYQLSPADRREMGLTDEQRRMIVDRYDGGLAFLDDRLGRLFDALAAAGRLQDTIVLVVADHGEVLDEHGDDWFSHDPHLWDENTHIPLLLRLPGGAQAGRRVDALVSQIDVAPTLLELAGLSAAALAPTGRSLAPLVEGRTLAPRPVLAERIGDDRSGKEASPEQVAASRDRKRSLRDGRSLLLDLVDRRSRALHATDGRAPAAADLSAREPQTLEQLLKLYAAMLNAERLPAAAGGGGGLDAETLALLHQMGYFGN